MRLLDLYAENFDPVMGCDERRSYNEHAPQDPALKSHIENLNWAQAILFVYPTWWYGLPAMLKGWLDRVWATDVAFRLPVGNGRIQSLVRHVTKIGVDHDMRRTDLVERRRRPAGTQDDPARHAGALRHPLQDVLSGALPDGCVDSEDEGGVSGESANEAGAVLRDERPSPVHGKKMPAGR